MAGRVDENRDVLMRKRSVKCMRPYSQQKHSATEFGVIKMSLTEDSTIAPCSRSKDLTVAEQLLRGRCFSIGRLRFYCYLEFGL